MRVLFVCSGNICRSPLAHAVFQELLDRRGVAEHYEIESAGTSAYHVGDSADPRMRRTAHGHGIRIDHAARQVSRSDLDTYELILVMDQQNYDSIMRMASNNVQRARVRLFREFDPKKGSGMEVPDPYYGGAGGFEEVYSIVERTSARLLEVLEGARTADA
jgi:protein-tyrosine phosphatase